MIKIFKTTFILALMSLSTLPMQGQDLLARQAPVDKKLKKVDSVALHQLIYQEMLDNPASDLYDEFDNIHSTLMLLISSSQTRTSLMTLFTTSATT